RILLPSTILLPPTSPLFPYTTLFRSPTGTGRQGAGHVENAQHVRFVVADRPVDGGQGHPRGIARAGAQFDRGRDAGERTEQAQQGPVGGLVAGDELLGPQYLAAQGTAVPAHVAQAGAVLVQGEGDGVVTRQELLIGGSERRRNPVERPGAPVCPLLIAPPLRRNVRRLGAAQLHRAARAHRGGRGRRNGHRLGGTDRLE